MATKDGRSQIWYADGNGSVDGYTETVDNIVETIIGAYNEHFGTEINIWTPETKTLQVGGTVPNWNAYEKIMLPPQPILVKVQRNSTTWYACEVKQSSNGQYEVAVHGGEGTFYSFNSTGHNNGTVMQSDENRSLIMQVASEKTSQNVTTLSIIPGYIDNIENWDEYI